MLTWKVWANDEDLLFEGSETDARAYVVDNLSEIPDLVLESPDGDSYSCQDGDWIFLGAAGSWGRTGPRDRSTNSSVFRGEHHEPQGRRCERASREPSTASSRRAWLRRRPCFQHEGAEGARDRLATSELS